MEEAPVMEANSCHPCMLECCQVEQQSCEDYTVMHAAHYLPTLTSQTCSGFYGLEPESTCLVQVASPVRPADTKFIFDSNPTENLLVESSGHSPLKSTERLESCYRVTTMDNVEDINVRTLTNLRPLLQSYKQAERKRRDSNLSAYGSATSAARERTQASTNYFSGGSQR